MNGGTITERKRARLLREPVTEIALAILAAVFALARLGTAAMRDYDEALYGSIAREILATGQWLSLHVDGQYYSHKPPLLFWLMACSQKMFGATEFATRLPTALFGIGGVVATYFLTRALFGRTAGLLAAVILMTAPQWLNLERQAMLDVPVATLLCIAAIGLTRRSVLLTGIAIGIALMIKGPLPMLAIVAAIAFAVVRREHLRIVLLSSVLGLVLASPWHMHQLLTHGHDFTSYYFGVNVAQRLTEGIEGHGAPWHYYIERIFYRWLNPWHVLSAIAIVTMTVRWRRSADSTRALLLWFWIPLVVLSFAGTKLHWYIMSVYVPLAILTAAWIVPLLDRRWIRAVVAVLVTLTLAQAAIFSLHLDRKSGNEDVRRALASLPSSASELWVSDSIPYQAARFYARKPVHAFAIANPPPQGAWILVRSGEERLIARRVVARTRTRVLVH